MTSTLIQARNISIGYDGKTLCGGISFDVCEGDCIMLCGSNGCGKTTLLKLIEKAAHSGFIPEEGTLMIKPECEVVMIPARIPKVKGFSLKDFIRICCYSQTDMGGKLSRHQEMEVKNAMDTLKISHLSDKDISTLSDGEFQKAGIAAGLVRKASVIILDEPTAFLDAENRISVLNLLKEVSGRILNDSKGPYRPAVIFSTHDLHDGLAASGKVFAFGADKRFRYAESDLEEAVKSIFTNRL